ncbi:MAG: prepilin-type N-terminal cleavage/methylation domain-containing protein [Patescibacteria group bacterium]|nr:prepilin-type N-terminal cleavage/methylation domain-containing protein [Patescibacteria group bacterium]
MFHSPINNFNKNKKPRSLTGFTLIELLIVIGILAVLATVTLLVINPAQMVKQSRDANRVTEINQINQALLFFQSFGGSSTAMGTHNTVYVSIPSSTSDCSGLGLPALGGGYVYHCSDSTHYRNIDGTGWIPVDLTSVQSSAGNLFFALPIDPINTVAGGLYYTYIPGSWALSATMESDKYLASNAANDGGQVSTRFELGNDLTLDNNIAPSLIPTNGLVAYWKFDEGGGTSVTDSSGSGNTGTWSGTDTHYVTGKVGSYAAQFNGSSDYVGIPTLTNNNFISSDLSVSLWIKKANATNSEEDFISTYGGGAYGWIFDLNNTSNIRFYNGTWAASSITISDTNWHYVSVTFNHSTYKVDFYVDGQFKEEDTASASITGNGTALSIGARNFPGYSNNFFSGLMDDVAVYSRVLSGSEITAIYNAEK